MINSIINHGIVKGFASQGGDEVISYRQLGFDPKYNTKTPLYFSAEDTISLDPWSTLDLAYLWSPEEKRSWIYTFRHTHMKLLEDAKKMGLTGLERMGSLTGLKRTRVDETSPVAS